MTIIQTPALKDLQVQLDKYIQAGKLTPQQAETQLLSSNAFNNIVTDPSYVGAQKQALQQMQQVATQGGLTAVDKAQLQDITNQQNQEAQGRNAAVMSQARERGMGGSDINIVNQLMNEQGAADRASQAGTNVAANAQTRALQAMQAAGTQGGQLQAQQYGEQANKAQAQNAIDLFNKQTLNSSNLYNTQTANAAQAANLENAQAINNANTGTSNANKEYNAQQVQQQYNDALQKAQGVSGIYGNWANDATAQKKAETGANMGLTSGLLQGGATALGAAMGGPAGAMAANSMTANGGKPNKNINESDLPGYANGGEVDHPEHPNHMAMGGHVHCYAYGETVSHHPDCYMSKGGFLGDLKKGALHKDLGVPSDKSIPSGKLEKATHSDNETLRKRAQFAENAKHWHHGKDGGEVPGHAKVEGNSPKNDTIEAKLSPGEVVVPRSAMSDDEEFNQFMEKFRPSNQHKLASGGMVPKMATPTIPRVNETNPMRDTAKSTSSNPVPLASVNDTTDFSQFMNKFKPTHTPPAVSKIPLEIHALTNLHQRIKHLEEGGAV